MEIPERYTDTRFGKLAVRKGYITVAQLKEALCEQVDDDVANRPHCVLGEILHERKVMTLKQVESVLAEVSAVEK